MSAGSLCRNLRRSTQSITEAQMLCSAFVERPAQQPTSRPFSLCPRKAFAPLYRIPAKFSTLFLSCHGYMKKNAHAAADQAVLPPCLSYLLCIGAKRTSAAQAEAIPFSVRSARSFRLFGSAVSRIITHDPEVIRRFRNSFPFKMLSLSILKIPPSAVQPAGNLTLPRGVSYRISPSKT